MARLARMLIKEEPTLYHIISRTALDGLPLGDSEKDFLVEKIKELSKVYFSEILGYCVMGDHFHMLVKMNSAQSYSDQDIANRFKLYFGDKKEMLESQIPAFRKRWANLSEFVKEIKQKFSKYYNKQHARTGIFWGDRFRSVVIENNQTLLDCLVYIDSMPVHAKMIKDSEDYKWSSLGYHVRTKNKDSFLADDFWKDILGVSNQKDILTKYKKYLAETINSKNYSFVDKALEKRLKKQSKKESKKSKKELKKEAKKEAAKEQAKTLSNDPGILSYIEGCIIEFNYKGLKVGIDLDF